MSVCLSVCLSVIILMHHVFQQLHFGPALTGDVTQLATHCHRDAYRRAWVLASRLGPLTAAHSVASAAVVVSRWPVLGHG